MGRLQIRRFETTQAGGKGLTTIECPNFNARSLRDTTRALHDANDTALFAHALAEKTAVDEASPDILFVGIPVLMTRLSSSVFYHFVSLSLYLEGSVLLYFSSMFPFCVFFQRATLHDTITFRTTF